jgi:hypothetical protein
MEKVNTLIQSAKHWMQTAGPAWDIFVTLFMVAAVLIWMDLFIGNKIRMKATGLIGIWIESALNWYTLRKNIAKANSLHLALRRKYWVVPIAGSYHVLNNRQRKRINNLLRKHKMVININDLLNLAVYHTS